MTPRARAIITEVSQLHGVPFEKIVVAGRVQKVFRARMAAAIRLDAETGYSTPQIGRLLGCDHTMILYYLGRLKKKPSKPKWRKPRVRRIYVKHDPPKRRLPPRRLLIPYAGADPEEIQFNRYRHTEERL